MKEFPEYYKEIEFTYLAMCGTSTKTTRGYLEPQFGLEGHSWFFSRETRDLIDADRVIDWTYIKYEADEKIGG